jgi:hypothetical protein
LKPHGVTAEAQVARISIKHGKDKFLVLTTGNTSKNPYMYGLIRYRAVLFIKLDEFPLYGPKMAR